MKGRPFGLLLALLVTGSASGGVYTLDIPEAIGVYTPVVSFSQDVDFGFAFASIERVEMRWMGHCDYGYDYVFDGNEYQTVLLDGHIYTRVDFDTGVIEDDYPIFPVSDNGYVVWGGGGTSITDTDGLLDGTAHVDIWFEGPMPSGLKPPGYFFPGQPATGAVYEYKIEVHGEAVPEPSGMLTFGTGLLGMLGFALRRRR